MSRSGGPSELEGSRVTTSLTRRTLLKAGGAGAVALSLPAGAAARARRLRHGAHLYRSAYKPLVGKRFSVRGSAAKLRLLGIEDLAPHQAGSEHAFALTFRVSRGGGRLDHSLPLLHHPLLGSFPLFLTAGKPSHYCAVINRLHA